jgi:chorismate synthase
MSQANSFGNLFSFSSFGESHGKALGVVIQGMPARVSFREDLLNLNLKRRRPGSSDVVSSRQEQDQPELLSGIFDGKTLGTPIAVIVRNEDARSQDYAGLSTRAGHADDVWLKKFSISDPRGGGRSSGRETLARVIAGSFAQMLSQSLYPKLSIVGFAQTISKYELQSGDRVALEQQVSTEYVDRFAARFPSPVQSPIVENLLRDAKAEGKSYGGVVEIWLDGVPAGLGQPVFHKLKADLASAMMSVGATIGVEFGEGFESTRAEGSEFHTRTDSDHYGGIRGGISTGERIRMRVALKPTSSVLDVAKKGRHDPCIVPRAIPVLEAMCWCVIADHFLWMRNDRIQF